MSREKTTEKRRHTLRAYAGLVLLVLLIAALAIGGGLYTGTLPREIIRAVLQSSLAVKADVGTTSVFGRPSLKSLRLFDVDDPGDPPAVDIENISLDYQLRPEDGRYIDTLDIGALRLHFAQIDQGNTNYDFILRLLEGPGGGGDPLPYVPRQINVALESLEVDQPAAAARIGSVEAALSIETMDRMRATLTGETVPVRWRLGEEDWHEPPPGTLDLDAAYDAGAFELKGTAQLPEFAMLDGQASGHFGSGGWNIDASLAESTLSGAVTGLLPEGLLPAPLRFDALTVEEGHITARGNSSSLAVQTASLDAAITGLEIGPREEPYLAGPVTLSVSSTEEEHIAVDLSLTPARLTGGILSLLPESMQAIPVRFTTAQLDAFSARLLYSATGWALPKASAKGVVSGLVAGPPDAPWFAGDVRFDGAANPGAGDLTQFALGLEDGQEAQVTVRRPGGGWQVIVDTTKWTRAQILAAIPEAWRERVANLAPTLDAADATTTFDYTPAGSTLRVTGDIIVAGEKGTISLTVALPSDGTTALTFSGSAALKGSILDFDGALPPQGGIEIHTRTNGLPLGQWPGLLRPGVLPEGVDAQVKGTLDVTQSNGAVQLSANLTGTPKAFGAFDLSSLGSTSVKGTGQFNSEFTRLSGNGLDIGFADGFQLDARQWSLDFVPAKLEAQVDGGGDLGWLATMFSLPDLYGEVTGSSGLTLTPETLRVTPKLETDLLGYGNYAVPYKQTLAATGALTYDYGTRALTGENVRLSLGDVNMVSASTLRIDSGDIILDGLEVRSDLSPLVNLEYLNDAKGTLNAQGRIQRKAGATEAKLSGTLDAESLVLPSTGSRLEGVHLTADVTYEGAFSGGGAFAAAHLEVGGVAVEDVKSDIIADGEALRLEGARPKVFGGETEINARVGVFEEGMPITLRVYTHGADLAQFTKEFKPPSVNLTGTAVGEIILVIKDMTISDLRVDLTAENGFTVNRDLVAQALMQQYVTNMPGGVSMGDIIEDVVGKSDQRPFDRGRITLGFVDGRVTGEAVLESDLLNLTVDIMADPEAIIEAIRLRQEEE